jgi:hypothetical protein
MTLNSIWRTPGNTSRSVGLQRLFTHIRSLTKVVRTMRFAARPPNVPPHLRHDVGLLNEHRMPDWWDLR